MTEPNPNLFSPPPTPAQAESFLTNLAGSSWLGGETPRLNARTTDEVAGVGIGVGKKERTKLKLSDKKSYYKIRDTAIEGMKAKFTHLKPIDEKASVEHFEAVYSVVTRFEDLNYQMGKNDMNDVFNIPSDFTFDANSQSYLPSAHARSVNLFSDANNIDIETIKHANAYFLKFGADYHGENIIWSGEKILNSCDSELRDKLIESTRNWSEEFKGGPTYLKLLLSLILSTTEKSLRSLTDKLARLKITDFDGENVTKAVSFIRGVVLILRDNKSLPTDLTSLILRIFKASTCEVFKLHVTNIDSLVELGVKTYDLDSLLTNLDQKYIELLGRSEWTAKSDKANQESSFLAGDSVKDILKIICFNCGAVGHGVNNCTQAKNDDLINLRIEIMSNYGKSREKQKPSGKPFGKQKDPLTVPPRRSESHQKSFDGVTKHWCGRPECRKWTDHVTKDHPSQQGHSASAAPDGVSTSDSSSSPSSDDASSIPSDESANSAYLASIYHFG